MRIDGYIVYVKNNATNFGEDTRIFDALKVIAERFLENAFSIEKGNVTFVVSSALMVKFDDEELWVSDGVINEANVANTDAQRTLKIHSRFSADFKNRTIYVYRDASGVRCLYHAITANGALFSSDEALICFALGSFALDGESLKQSIALGYIYDEERTAFENVKQHLPGMIYKYTYGGTKLKAQMQNKASKAKARKYKSIAEATDTFSKIFENTVKYAVSTDTKKAFFLSGGVDSTAIAIAAKKFLPEVNTIRISSIIT